MATTREIQVHHMRVCNDRDVVTMRQEVRQCARELGLGLVQQAKIATAISEISRALLAWNNNIVFTMQTDHKGRHPALAISCVPPMQHLPADITQLGQLPHFSAACSLVDEASLTTTEQGGMLTLRMWLPRS